MFARVGSPLNLGRFLGAGQFVCDAKLPKGAAGDRAIMVGDESPLVGKYSWRTIPLIADGKWHRYRVRFLDRDQKMLLEIDGKEVAAPPIDGIHIGPSSRRRIGLVVDGPANFANLHFRKSR